MQNMIMHTKWTKKSFPNKARIDRRRILKYYRMEKLDEANL